MKERKKKEEERLRKIEREREERKENKREKKLSRIGTPRPQKHTTFLPPSSFFLSQTFSSPFFSPSFSQAKLLSPYPPTTKMQMRQKSATSSNQPTKVEERKESLMDIKCLKRETFEKVFLFQIIICCHRIVQTLSLSLSLCFSLFVY